MDTLDIYKATLDSIEDGLIIKDNNHVIIQANKATEELFGYNTTDLIGTKIEKLISNHFLDQNQKIENSHTVKEELSYTKEIGYQKKDGTQLFFETRINTFEIDTIIYTTYLIKNRVNNNSIESKINQKTHLENQLLELYNFKQAVLEIEDYAFLLINCDGDIKDWNKGAHRIKGYLAEEIIGKNFRLFYTESDLKLNKPENLIKQATLNGCSNDEGWRVKKDGSLFWASVTITSIHDANNNLIGFSKVTRDLSEKKELENEREIHINQLISKNKELEQFTYIASHDLQEPLRSLISFSELLLEEDKDAFNENTIKYISFISNASIRMKELVKGLMDFSRIGKESRLETVNLNQTIQNVILDLTSAIKDNNATIIFPVLPELNGYPVELRLLFQNLISNALKFTRKDIIPEIKITFKDKGNKYLFKIEDNGIGIEAKNLDKIFVIFQRLHNRNDFEGSGIGLSHAKKIVNLHGGSIWAESKLGIGSAFNFTIPKIKNL